MTSTIQNLLPYVVVAVQIVLAVLLVSLFLKNKFAKWVGKYALILGFLVSFTAVSGSLFYSEIVGFEPCVLCWWQRIALYPMPILFLVALLNKDRGVFKYVVPLITLGGIVALYHSYVYWGGASILPCTVMGGACSKNFVYVFGGYINIPAMSLTVIISLLLLAWSNKVYQSRQ
ncbi:MAG: disulfide bond formation protein B [Candidatus Zambryskibacteria bacterium]|nr:disulfide bond formation protein B [Candidatus Zambryskibacteria bacterium]